MGHLGTYFKGKVFKSVKNDSKASQIDFGDQIVFQILYYLGCLTTGSLNPEIMIIRKIIQTFTLNLTLSIRIIFHIK